jgi:hypothetical protein
MLGEGFFNLTMEGQPGQAHSFREIFIMKQHLKGDRHLRLLGFLPLLIYSQLHPRMDFFM